MNEHADERIVFQLEFERGADPITGLLRADGQELGFVGWVALAGALERALNAPDPGPGAKSGVDPP